MKTVLLNVVVLLFVAVPFSAQARNICTVVADARTGDVVFEQGDCDARVTPASTFKIPLALMGFDAGVLTDERSPSLAFRQGYPDWIAEWRQTTDPARWMKYSVVWFSQQVAGALGAARLEAYAAAFGYGNADFSGDPGRDNGLERAWISSSLRISPREQVAFLRSLVNGRLPVSDAALDMTGRIVERTALSGGGNVWGKTGSAYPRNRDGTFDRARGWGWFVGWVEHGDRWFVFARLDQDEERHDAPGGIRARSAFLAQWPSVLDGIAGNR